MAKETRIGFREDPEIKREAAIILKSMGLDISSTCRLLLRQIIRTRSIPFRVESGFTPEGERTILKADQQLEEDIKAGKTKEYTNAKDLLDDLED